MTAKIENLAERRASVDRRSEKPAAGPTGPARERKKGAARCPICGAARVEKYRPFCSSRCAEIDLGRWLKESYRVPGQDRQEAADDEPED